MKQLYKTLAPLTLAFLLAACGGEVQDADDPIGSVAGEADTPSSSATVPSNDALREQTAKDAQATPGDPEEETGQEEEGAVTPASSPAPAAAATPSPSASVEPVAAVERPQAFVQCGACHSVEPGKHGIGPSLAGIVDTGAAEIPGFNFSPAMKASGLTWDEETLDRFLADPRKVVPGTTMPFMGVKDEASRKAIIEYLKSL